METTKCCSSCKQQKLLGDYYSKGSGTDRTCKECRRKRRNNRYNDSKSTETNPKLNDALAVSANPSEGFGTPKGTDHLHHIDPEDIRKIAEAFLLLEAWQMDLDTQQEISNSKQIQNQTGK